MSILTEQGEIRDPYRSFISKSRYSKWLPEEARREKWVETVDRYVDAMKKKVETDHHNAITPKTWQRIRTAILNHEVMPSMRGLMTAGPALERSELAIYNCSFCAIDAEESFSEILWILLHGTGVGFSVESKYVSQLNSLPADFKAVSETIVVEDSKEGWAQAYKSLISYLFVGELPSLDITKVRPAGARLKTFGGRASGPQPLVDLFDFTIAKFKAAAGRKLTPLEAHDIVCKIGDVVVVGGVRRAALISLSDLDSYEMAKAKSGAWWESNPQRALANNSAVYEKKPSIGEFLQEWGHLYESKSGERGIFNRQLAQSGKYAPRRKAHLVEGVNPCVTGDTWVITQDGPRQVADIVGDGSGTLALDGQNNISETGFFWTGEKDVLKVTLDNGASIRVTTDHKIMTERGWVEAGSLTFEDSVRMSVNKDMSWTGEGTSDEGYLLGLLVGDGTFAVNACIDVWSDSDGIMQAAERAASNAGIDLMFKPQTQVGNDKKWRAQSRSFTALAARFGIVKGAKFVSKQVEEASSEFYAGFLRGYFDADGSAQGNKEKGVSVRLASVSQDNLHGVQRMLGRLGILSKVYLNRHEAGIRMLPDSDRNLAPYQCKALHELIVSRDAILEFSNRVGFSHVNKADRLAEMLTGKRSLYKTNIFSRVVEIKFDGHEDVYDANVHGVHAFDANGIYVHNCSEIDLRNHGLCNLSEVIVDANDDLESLLDKVEVATIIGTIQSTFTDFSFLRPSWKENAEEERLLGVSLTGQFGNELLSGKLGKRALNNTLVEMRKHAISTNKTYAKELGINQSAAITCAKPSGTVSQLTYSSAGMHPWHSQFYLRTVRADIKDPMNQFLTDIGIPSEPDLMKPDTSTVFTFPVKAPENATTRHDLSAVEHLDIWLTYKKYWTEHNPSITVSVKEDEWIEVANWVYDNWDDVGGLSFLPFDEHTYKQAPYQECDETTYNQFYQDTPKVIDWSMLEAYEQEDNTTGSMTLACTSSACELVDIGAS